MMMTKIYLAYGSNLNIEQMARRCPTALVLGSTKLRGYKATFRGMDGGAVMNIEPDAAGVVPVLLWEIEPADEMALDRYEVFPRLYRKKIVTVTFKGERVTAMAYIMNEGPPLGAPGNGYYYIIRQGYKEAGFDIGILHRAIKESAFPEQELRYKPNYNFRW
jgi:hypothetical protein